MSTGPPPPVSILDRDQGRPIVIEPDDTPDIVIPLIILILFIVFIGWMLYLLVTSGFAQTGADGRVPTDNRSNPFQMCFAGQCPTDVITGFKACPPTDVPVTYIPGKQVCNARYLCDSPQTPFAVQTDSSTNLYGVCEPETECQCLNYSQCPQYVRSTFTVSNGNAYELLPGQRILFPQSNSFTTTNGISSNPPFQFRDPGTTFCSVPISWLPLSNPGCNFVATPNALTYDDLVTCMGLISGCTGIQSSPCLDGVLALIASNPDTLNQQNIVNTQVACVAGEPCPCGTVAIFDTNFGGIVCRNLPPPPS